jgi:hypothetical protein
VRAGALVALERLPKGAQRRAEVRDLLEVGLGELVELLGA